MSIRKETSLLLFPLLFSTDCLAVYGIFMFINLTPHNLNFQDANGKIHTINTSETICRVGTKTSKEVGKISSSELPWGFSAPIFSAPVFTSIIDLPDAEDGKVFIVSGFVAAAMRAAGMDRPDVIVPGTGPKDGCIRENGRIVAVTRFVRAT